MRMNTNQLINLEISLQELTNAFQQLPAQEDKPNHRYAVKFTLLDSYGKPCERELLFYWNQDQHHWELNTKAYDLIITCPPY